MKNIDKLISALYLAKSDNREKMLSDLVLNIMYGFKEPLDTDSIIDCIKDFFHLEPIKYEVQQCLNSLVESQQINQKGTYYCLSEQARSQVHSYIVKSKDNTERRFSSFIKIVNDIFSDDIESKNIKILWEVFNEYLLECFMVFGRKAINIFLPYKDDELLQDNSILEQAYKNLKSDKLISVFKKLVVEYPERLTEAELRHLNVLALRAEKFYSLGIEKQEYEKINNLQIRNLIVLADTNILYTILNLHVHQEKSAITEIMRLAKEKIIDFRIVYLPHTYKELQKAKLPLENAISREKFKNSQIKVMLSSGNLDTLAKQYYENRLQNSDYPHPADNITYASDILKQHGIVIYNPKFKKLDEDDEYLNKKIIEYYDYQQFYNNLSDEKGSAFRLNKDDYKIEHDVYLREAVKILKEKFSKDILKFISLTIDRSLVQFDLYAVRKENIGSHRFINPNFMLPSIFIKKIRPFIPIVTNNYRKAFLSSLTAPSFERPSEDEKERNIMIQKSMTYFKNLGIEDEEVICSIIKRELFLEELAEHEKDNTSEDFIKSEIAKEIDNKKSVISLLEKEIATQKETAESALEKEKEKTEKIKTEKEKTEKEKQSEIDKLLKKIKEKESFKEQLQKLNEEQAKFSKEKSIEAKKIILEEINQSIIILENTQKPVQDIIETRHKNYKWRLSIIPVVYFFILCFLIYKLTWDVMEPYTYLFSLVGVVCSYLYFAISGESLSPLKHFDNKKAKITSQVYLDFKFDIEYLNRQRQRRTKLESEIEKLSKTMYNTTLKTQ